MSLRIAVTGGRNYNDKKSIFEALDNLQEKRGIISEIAHGMAKGADTISGEWAKKKGITEIRFPARWDLYGRSAGPIRNRELLESAQPDLLLAFPGGRGTADMVSAARSQSIEVVESKSLT